MDTTRSHVDKLLTEMNDAINTIVEEGKPEFDWSDWIRNVEGLRTHLFHQLNECRGKFSNDTTSVGDFATQQEIQESVQCLSQRLFE